MKALIRDGIVEQIVSSLDGIDLDGVTVVDDVPEPIGDYAWNADSQAFEPTPAIARYQLMLDEAVDRIRGRYPAIGQYIVEEYRIAADQAQAFKNAGYEGDAPLAVDAWARAASMTAQAAADDILATKVMYETMLLVTRDARLCGKARIAQCTTVEAARAEYETILSEIEAMIPEP